MRGDRAALRVVQGGTELEVYPEDEPGPGVPGLQVLAQCKEILSMCWSFAIEDQLPRLHGEAEWAGE